MLFALGLGGDVVAVTHECDFPPQASELPHLTSTVLPEGLSAGEIDAAVKAIVGEGKALYSLDEERLAALAPDLIVTQAVCDVCAVSFEDVVEVAARLPGRPRVVQQDPSSIGEVLDDVTRLGAAAGIEARALELRGELEARLAAVRAAVAGSAPARTVALEWLDPPFVGGHWLPEMIAFAGGIDVAGPPGAKSPEVEWEHLAALRTRPGRRHALWDVRRGSQAAGDASTGRVSRRSERVAYSPSTPPRPTRAPAPAWSMASSCSPTFSTLTEPPRPPGIGFVDLSAQISRS